MRGLLGVVLLPLLACLSAPLARGARIKDIASLEGVRNNQLVGYGLVVGLNGTGDGNQSVFTFQSLTNTLRRLGILVDPARVKVKNVAAVFVTAEIPPFARAGRSVDVNVSSVGDAKSLLGGTLLLTPLRGPDGNVYATAQGQVSVGGSFSASAGGSSAQRNHPTAGRIPSGALVEREAVYALASHTEHRLLLKEPDFTTASRVEQAINEAFGPGTAHAEDSGGVTVHVPAEGAQGTVAFLARLEELGVDPDVPARLVFNEKTGTVVMGADLKVSRVAISHGSLNIKVETDVAVSQPAPFSQGDTKVIEQPDVEAREEPAHVVVLDEGATIGDLVGALNRIGATSRDMIAIFQAIRSAGALQAEIVVQ